MSESGEAVSRALEARAAAHAAPREAATARAAEVERHQQASGTGARFPAPAPLRPLAETEASR